jgi:DNA (cytosine-5)-methyltransferase 1
VKPRNRTVRSLGQAAGLQVAQRGGWVGSLGTPAFPAGDGPIAIDLFSGCGGLSLGFHSAGYRVVGAVEAESLAAFTYAANFPDVTLYGPSADDPESGDISKLDPDQLRSVIRSVDERIGVLLAGPPCQGFSTMGRRMADDPRNGLYKHFVRMLKGLRPDAYVFENVPGILAPKNSDTFRNLITAIRELGYSASWKLVNAATYGVPQLRTRVFVVGARCVKPSFADGELQSERYVTVSDAFCGIPDQSDGSAKEMAYKDGPLSRYATLMKGKCELLTNCGMTAHSPEVVERFQLLEAGAEDTKTGHRRLSSTAPSWTLRAGSRSRTACRPVHPTQPRVITVREAARLASFPDKFWLPPQIAGAHMLLGNSVPPLLSHRLALTLAESVFDVRP